MVTKVGPMQDSMASGSNPADAQGPGFALTDEHQRPLFVFIFENQAQRDAAAKQLAAILKRQFWRGPRGYDAEVHSANAVRFQSIPSAGDETVG